jgi:DNA-binding GntR family transcriptional regulator
MPERRFRERLAALRAATPEDDDDKLPPGVAEAIDEQRPARRASGKVTDAERVYGTLRLQLLRGDLPAGERLVEQRLAEEYQTSRTPVREALRRLEGDGHLVRDASGGLRPRVPDVRSMRDFYDVRLALEDLTVRRAAAVGDRAIIERLQLEWRNHQAVQAATTDGNPLPDLVGPDEMFHLDLAVASGNQAAHRYLEEITDRIHVLRIQGFTIDHRLDNTVEEHLEILDAILTGDGDAAAAFMRSHIQRHAQVVRDRVGVALARMFEAR